MNQLVAFLPVLAALGAFLYFASRRQRKVLDATIALHDSLSIGDRVHTTGGLEGEITAIDEDTVDLEIADGVVTRWMKMAIRDKIEDEDSSAQDTTSEATAEDVESTGVELNKE